MSKAQNESTIMASQMSDTIIVRIFCFAGRDYRRGKEGEARSMSSCICVWRFLGLLRELSRKLVLTLEDPVLRHFERREKIKYPPY